ncbi:isoamylase early set domain-containing protein [Georgenia thermotolerans]|uniref:Isoamylase n=1 Tax=Georgenia thermotolerans TaxID=527326 RepID=A0A7J5UMF8_9MICO|nr:isoamylase early set domain-containing protein [Georgenia thermotolerans]KAE8763294.1 isoamylase [Georgenia thermotolerans]
MIKQSRAPRGAGRKLTFALPADHPAGTVSVVGSFNDWTPGVHVLRRRSNGTKSVTVTVPEGTPVVFRYLGENGQWFDDPDADALTHEGGLVHA